MTTHPPGGTARTIWSWYAGPGQQSIACHSLMCNAPGPTSPVSPLADLPLWRTDCDFAPLNTPCLALAGADRSASRRTAERVQVCDFSSYNVACSMRIMNAMQSFYAGSKSRRWAVVNECEVTNHSGYQEIWRHMRFSCFRYYIAFAMAMSYEKLHIVLYYRLLHSCKAEVTWRELCGLQNSGLPILAN